MIPAPDSRLRLAGRIAFLGLFLGCFAAASLVSASLSAAEPAGPTPSFAEVQGWVKEYCGDCHGKEVKEGRIDLTRFMDELSVRKDRKLWSRVLVQIETLEMPPKDAEALPGPLREAWATWIKQTLQSTEGLEPRPGRTPARRLSRTQYDRTVYDLTGVRFASATEVGMPDDVSTNAFDHFAEALTLPPELIDKYFAASEKIVARLTDKPPPPAAKRNKNAQGAERDVYLAWDKVFIAEPGPNLAERDAARQVVERFASRAFRRPVEPRETERYLALYDQAAKEKLSHLDRMKWLLRAVLSSPHFLLRVEEDRAPAGDSTAYRINDSELAVRLSYFLWASMPDDELARLAEEKKLSDPAVLEAQVRRMLLDPKAESLTSVFAYQWLQLGKLAHARPSTEFFPSFNHRLRQSMLDEANAFMNHLRTEDRSLREMLDCDYVFVNKELARHYQLPQAKDNAWKGEKLEKVSLRPEDHRGGILGMGAVLAMSSHTSRTSPTLRGKWVLEALLGAPPPPPPANVGSIDEKQAPGKEPKTFRELLAQHAHQKTCAGCHAKIDPLGFGLENFDAVGRWREAQPADKKQPAMDVSGKLPTGEAFVGFGGLKELLKTKEEAFLRNAAEQMLTYALGRDPAYFDEPALRTILADWKAKDARYSELVLAVVRSFPFQHRCNTDSAD